MVIDIVIILRVPMAAPGLFFLLSLNMPETTVLIPSYNGAKYIQSALLSVLSQKYTDYEILIIDDGSTDNTEELVKILEDKRIRYYKNESNMGIVASLNRGLDLAEGKYIARMDADDLMLGNRLQARLIFWKKTKITEWSVAGIIPLMKMVG